MNYSNQYKNNYKRDAVRNKEVVITGKIHRKTVTGKQGLIMEQLLYTKPVTEWEKKFLRVCLKSNHLSYKQKTTLNNLYVKYIS